MDTIKEGSCYSMSALVGLVDRLAENYLRHLKSDLRRLSSETGSLSAITANRVQREIVTLETLRNLMLEREGPEVIAKVASLRANILLSEATHE